MKAWNLHLFGDWDTEAHQPGKLLLIALFLFFLLERRMLTALVRLMVGSLHLVWQHFAIGGDSKMPRLRAHLSSSHYLADQTSSWLLPLLAWTAQSQRVQFVGAMLARCF